VPVTQIIVKSLAYAPASLAGSGEKLGTDPRIDQPACCGLCREPFFSGAVGSIQICRRPAKGCHIRGPPAGSVCGRTWTGVGSVHVVLVGFSPAGCTSIRITVTLGYE
jgi:hypothetical protein